MNEPEIPQGSEWILRAYSDLSTDRSANGEIRWSVARQWFEHSGHLEEVWPIFWECMTEIDAAYRSKAERDTGTE